MSNNFEKFVDTCSAQGVVFEPEFLDLQDQSFSIAAGARSVAPTSMLKAMVVAGSMLREEPDRPLVINQTIDVETGSFHTFTQLTLATMLNASNRPIDAQDTRPQFNELATEPINTCAEAESRFAETFFSLGYDKPEELMGSQVFVDEEQVPVLLRKDFGEKSTIALSDIVIKGVPYPAGSLVRLEIAGDISRDSVVMYGQLPDSGLEVLPLGLVENIAFSRLSAFALPAPERRLAFRMELIGINNPDSRRFVTRVGRASLRGIVQAAMANEHQQPTWSTQRPMPARLQTA